MNAMLFLLPVVVFACAVQGATEPPQGFLLSRDRVMPSAKTVDAARFPDADQVLVDDHVLETYEKDGQSVLWDDEYTKILTEKGRRDASTLSFSFDLAYGTALVYRAEIIKPDGRVLSVDIAKYSRVMVDTSQMGENIYDPNSKTLNVSIPGLEIGDVRHLVTSRITKKARMPDTWSDYSVFEYDSPIVRLDYDVSAPPERPIRHKVLRAPLSNTVSYAENRLPNGRTLHRWHVANVPRMFPEPDMPPLYTQVQRLILSTIEDWRTVSRWYWRLCLPALEKTTPAMRAKVNELIAGTGSREEKIRRIFKFVSQEIRYMGIMAEATAPGYEPHEVSLTFENRYGVCRDKAALLAAMLRLADVPAYPVLIHAGAKMDPDVPLPFFNHAITAIDKPGGGYLLMDPTDENTRDLFPAYLCNRSYLVAKPEGETLLVSDVYPAEKNLTRIASDGTLDETGALLLKTRIAFEGINDNAYRGHLLRLKADQRRKFFEGVLKRRLSGAEVVECVIAPDDLQDTETPLSVTLTTRVRDYPVRGKTLDLVSMPWLGTALGYANFVIGQTGLKTRRFPLATDITCGTKESVRLSVSSGLGPVYALPDTVAVDRAGVRFEMRQSVTNGVLSGQLAYLLKTPEFSPADYLELRKILEEMEAASRRKPLFRATDRHAPDQETLSDVTETQLSSARAWTTTRTWSKRILTYAGKKKGAELKFGYNPVWQTVDVVSATVSNCDGSVRAVTPKEMNIMDASWAGSAPRYPAGKILVVNLPGVETGSVVTVSTRFVQTNAFFYSHVHTFGGTEPVRCATYRLSFPKTLTPNVQLLHGAEVCVTAETNASGVVWTWQMGSPPVVRSEEQLPPWHLFQPTLYVSFGEWRAYAKRLRRAIDAVSDDDRAVRRRARELVKGIRDPRKQILAIRDDVLRKVRADGPSYTDLPPETLSSPDRTWADQYGHLADRAILLAAMLDAAGLDAEIVFASGDTTRYAAYSQPSRDVPQAGYFLFPLVAVHRHGETIYLNEGDQYDELGCSGFDGAPVLDLHGKISAVSVAAPLKDRSEQAWTITLDAEGTAAIAVTNFFFGTNVGLFRKQYREMLPEDRRRHQLEVAASIAKSAEIVSDLTADTAGYPGVRSIAVKATKYAAVENGMLTFQIPDVSGAVFPVRADTRENPLFLSSADESRVTCRVILPPGYHRIKILPAPCHWTFPCGLGLLDYDVQMKDGADGRTEVWVSRRLKRNSGEVAAELYPALLDYNRRFTHPSVRMLVAERDTQP